MMCQHLKEALNSGLRKKISALSEMIEELSGKGRIEKSVINFIYKVGKDDTKITVYDLNNCLKSFQAICKHRSNILVICEHKIASSEEKQEMLKRIFGLLKLNRHIQDIRTKLGKFCKYE